MHHWIRSLAYIVCRCSCGHSRIIFRTLLHTLCPLERLQNTKDCGTYHVCRFVTCANVPVWNLIRTHLHLAFGSVRIACEDMKPTPFSFSCVLCKMISTIFHVYFHYNGHVLIQRFWFYPTNCFNDRHNNSQNITNEWVRFSTIDLLWLSFRLVYSNRKHYKRFITVRINAFN